MAHPARHFLTGRRRLLAVAAAASAVQLAAPPASARAEVSARLARGAMARFKITNPPRPVPDLEFLNADDRPMRLSDLNGKVRLINLWATWCAPCVAELPDLLAGTRTFRDNGGVVVTVAMEQLGLDLTVEQAVAKATTKAKELGFDVPVLVCTDDEMTKIRQVLGVEIGGLPQTLTYDRAGKLVHQHEGPADAEEFAALAKDAAAH